ncbi:MAG: sugar phosphate nucleotidyltransferase, partial [Dehalococcoidia bacterium]
MLAKTSYGEILFNARSDRGITRQSLGVQADVDPSHLFRIEKGMRNPPKRQKVIDIAKALNLSPEETDAHLQAAGYSPVPLGALRTAYTAGFPDPTQSTSSAQTNYQDALLGFLGQTLAALPEEVVSHAMSTLSGFTETLRSLNRASDDVEPGPIQVVCLPVAGWQWREWPASRIIESIKDGLTEAISAGISEAVIVLPSNQMSLVQKYLSTYLYTVNLQVKYVAQDNPLGLGHAVLLTKDVIGNRPFALVLPDDKFYLDGETVLGQLISIYGRQPEPSFVVALAELKTRQRHYGQAQIKVNSGGDKISPIENLVEKPLARDMIFRGEQAKTLHIIGRY